MGTRPVAKDILVPTGRLKGFVGRGARVSSGSSGIHSRSQRSFLPCVEAGLEAGEGYRRFFGRSPSSFDCR